MILKNEVMELFDLSMQVTAKTLWHRTPKASTSTFEMQGMSQKQKWMPDIRSFSIRYCMKNPHGRFAEMQKSIWKDY